MTPVQLPPWIYDARRSGFLSRLSPRHVSELIEGGRRVDYPAGSTLLGWDAEPAGMIVLAGSLRVYLSAPDGSQVTLRYIRPGDVVGLFSSNDAAPVRNLEAVDDSQLLHLDVSRVAALTRSEPDFAWEMVSESARVLGMINRAYGIRACGSIRMRVANAILERAGARGGVRSGTMVPGTQTELAIATGTVREVVAAALKQMKQQGIIEIKRGGLVILDEGRLRSEADAAGFGVVAG